MCSCNDSIAFGIADWNDFKMKHRTETRISEQVV